MTTPTKEMTVQQMINTKQSIVNRQSQIESQMDTLRSAYTAGKIKREELSANRQKFKTENAQLEQRYKELDSAYHVSRENGRRIAHRGKDRVDLGAA